MADIKSETITGGSPGSGAHRVVALCGPYLSGKTSLLESILYATGAIGRRGSTRAGTSIGDGAAESRKRGMGTEINVASVDYLGDQWTFLDVPGSIEFQHDAFAALAVCDTAVLVCEPSPERVVARLQAEALERLHSVAPQQLVLADVELEHPVVSHGDRSGSGGSAEPALGGATGEEHLGRLEPAELRGQVRRLGAG